jgi:hypothetical protein
MEESIQFDWGRAVTALALGKQKDALAFRFSILLMSSLAAVLIAFTGSARGNNYETQTGVLSVFAASRLAGISSVDERASERFCHVHKTSPRSHILANSSLFSHSHDIFAVRDSRSRQKHSSLVKSFAPSAPIRSMPRLFTCQNN